MERGGTFGGDLAVNGTLVFRHDARRHGAGLIDLYWVE
jgi:hypothetical protein